MGNKAILMSIQPKWVAKILNGEKTIEIRKKFPKDYVGWVYIYCTKAKPNAHIWTLKVKEKPYKVIFSKTQMQQERDLDNFMNVEFIEKYPQYAGERIICHPEHINGYVVGRFWCNKVEEIKGYNILDTLYETASLKEEELLKLSCLKYQELNAYLKIKNGSYAVDISKGYAIHISQKIPIYVFDKPKELKEFRILGNCKKCLAEYNCGSTFKNFCSHKVKKAPQSWCYFEGY